MEIGDKDRGTTVPTKIEEEEEIMKLNLDRVNIIDRTHTVIFQFFNQ